MVILEKILKSRVIQLSAVIFCTVMAGSIYADSKTEDALQLAALTDGFDAEATYMKSCFACHSTGAAGAPKVGDAEAWATRLEKGMEVLIASSVDGLNGVMPPKGLCFTCTDEDLAAIVEYMLDNSK